MRTVQLLNQRSERSPRVRSVCTSRRRRGAGPLPRIVVANARGLSHESVAGSFANRRMKHAAVLIVAALLAGCATHRDDPRLQGTWHSNREATVAEAFRRDPRWTNAPPERVEQFRDIFGHMTIAYSNGMQTVEFRGETRSFGYRVIERGRDYVIISSQPALDKGRGVRIRFVDHNTAYWIDTGPLGLGLQERFDRVTKPANPQAGAHGRQPPGPETERAPAALGPRPSP